MRGWAHMLFSCTLSCDLLAACTFHFLEVTTLSVCFFFFYQVCVKYVCVQEYPVTTCAFTHLPFA